MKELQIPGNKIPKDSVFKKRICDKEKCEKERIYSSKRGYFCLEHYYLITTCHAQMQYDRFYIDHSFIEQYSVTMIRSLGNG